MENDEFTPKEITTLLSSFAKNDIILSAEIQRTYFQALLDQQLFHKYFIHAASVLEHVKGYKYYDEVYESIINTFPQLQRYLREIASNNNSDPEKKSKRI